MRPPLISTDMGSSLLYDEFKLALVALSPSRAVAELKELRELTGDEDGAQRVAWTDTWETARAWLREKLGALPLEHEIDEAGNQWWTRRGGSERAVPVGGPPYKVPDGGRLVRARQQLEGAAAYLELHIEQGPVLESLELPLGVVLGTFGVERHEVTFRGQAAHAGSTPMEKRRDALAGAAKLELEIREIAARVGDGAVCTMGGVVTRPGIVTSVVETAEGLLDQRHLDASKLAEMLSKPEAAARRVAQGG